MNSKILLILLFFCASFYKSAAQAPPNDDCTGAIAIATVPFGTACSTSVSASTLDATASTPGTSCVASPDDDIWFQFTASSSSIIFRYTNARNPASGNQASPSFALYQTNCPINTTTFFCQAVTVSGDGFRIINGLTPGATYYLRLWSLNPGIVMNIDFCIQNVNAAPSNDECANAQAIATLPPGSSCTSPLFTTTVGATQSTPAPSCSGSSHNDDIWYSFVANTSAASIQFSNARLATSNGNANLGYAVYNNACPTTTATMFCNGNLGGNSGSVTVNGLVPGNTYYIRFFSLGDNNYMTFQFCVIDIIVAQNDECANALNFRTYNLGEIAIPGRISTASATHSPNDPDCAGGENNDDVWYRFTATTSSIILQLKNAVVNETGGGGTAGYALYEGACPASAATFSCNTIASAGNGEHIVNGLTPATEYYLRLWSTLGGGNTVSFDLTILNVSSSSNDECINAIPITTQASDSSCNSTMHASTAGATKSSPDPSCSNGYNDEDIWYSFVASSNAVRINFSNAAKVSGSGSSTLGFALHSGSCATVPITAGCQANIGTGNGTVLVGGLTPGQTYLLRFYSYDVNNYIQFDFCVVDAELPENDECNNATAILTGSGFCTSPVTGRLRNATTSAGFAAPSCAPMAATQDVWFRTNIPASGNLIIQTSSINNSGTEDLVMEVYTGACGSLTLIACNDDGNPDPAANEFHPRISLTGRTAGEQIYLRVMKKYPVTYNEFGICAWDSTVLIPIAQGGNCVPAEPITIDAAHGNNWMWVPIMDASKHIIAEINARGSNLGAVTANLFVNSSGTVRNLNGHFYLDRNVAIDPQTSGPTWIRLYIRNNELQSLMTADASITGTANLKLTKTDAACGPAFAGTATIIQQDTSGNYGADHFIEFPVQSFSSFFVDGGLAALPLEFVSFKAEKQNGHINLNWVVVQDETIARFELQRSNDGISFIGIGEKNPRDYISDNNNNWQYNFRDDNPAAATVFYRVKMVDENGKQVYSKVVALTATDYNGPISIYPNPVSRYLIIRMPLSVTSAGWRLFNASGALVKQLSGQPVSNGVYTLDMQDQPAGIYFLHVNTGRNWHQLKVIKR